MMSGFGTFDFSLSCFAEILCLSRIFFRGIIYISFYCI
jgi:hypothetical protein